MKIQPKKSEGPAATGHSANIESINDLDFPTGQRPSKAFFTLAAQFAMAGYSFARSNPADGAVTYYAGRWNYCRAFASLQEAAQYLERIGGGQ
jgi:hypothetical protein